MQRGCVSLLQIPSTLIGRIWPPERVVIGRRVCGQLHRELQECVENILLSRDSSVPIVEEDIEIDFVSASKGMVSLQWKGSAEETCAMLRAALRSGLANSLEHLHSGYRRGDERHSVAKLLTECTALKSLSLRGSWTGDAHTHTRDAEMSRALSHCTTLKQLDLTGNWIGDDGVGKLSAILEHCTMVSHLDLSMNAIGRLGAGWLPLRHCKHLSHLSLAVNNIGDAGAGRLAGVLAGCKSLIHLDLSANGIGCSGVASLAMVLGACCQLREILMRYNFVSDTGASRLAAVLPQFKQLALIDLQGNCVGDEGAGRLEGALQASAKLERIVLNDSELTRRREASPTKL